MHPKNVTWWYYDRKGHIHKAPDRQKSSFGSCCICTRPFHQMLEFARLLHVHALLIPPPVESLVQQPLMLHEINLQ